MEVIEVLRNQISLQTVFARVNLPTTKVVTMNQESVYVTNKVVQNQANKQVEIKTNSFNAKPLIQADSLQEVCKDGDTLDDLERLITCKDL